MVGWLTFGIRASSLQNEHPWVRTPSLALLPPPSFFFPPFGNRKNRKKKPSHERIELKIFVLSADAQQLSQHAFLLTISFITYIIIIILAERAYTHTLYGHSYCEFLFICLFVLLFLYIVIKLWRTTPSQNFRVSRAFKCCCT